MVVTEHPQMNGNNVLKQEFLGKLQTVYNYHPLFTKGRETGQKRNHHLIRRE